MGNANCRPPLASFPSSHTVFGVSEELTFRWPRPTSGHSVSRPMSATATVESVRESTVAFVPIGARG